MLLGKLQDSLQQCLTKKNIDGFEVVDLRNGQVAVVKVDVNSKQYKAIHHKNNRKKDCKWN